MEESKEDARSGTIAVHRLEAASTDFDNQMATFHFLGELGSKLGPLLKISPDGSAIPPPPQNLAPKKNDEMNFIFSLDAFSWKAMQHSSEVRSRQSDVRLKYHETKTGREFSDL